MEKMIVANHKMNLSIDQVNDYINEIKASKLNIVIAPTNIYIPYFLNNGIKVAIQNIYYENMGNYTGEVSPMQAKKLGVQYVLVGHSERRRIFHENDDVVNKKVKAALSNGLKVILCIGENIGENYKEVLHRQIVMGLKDVSDKVIISYEPVYAIGTNIIPDKDELKEIISYIRSHFDYDVKVLYGGSVNKDDALDLKMDEIDGYLIGSVSLNPKDFIEIGEVLM
ncbi:MAG: triosephosphate isomerase [Bacilli bacterium]|nr:triosephosphate isomerase [Bacilli bacterium]